MPKTMLDVFVYHTVPMLAIYIAFGNYIHIGRNYLTIPDEVIDDMTLRAKERGMGYIPFVRKVLKLALTFERIEADPKMKIIIEKEDEEQKEFVF